MAESYRARIEAYCEAHGIAVPGGFRRNAPSRFAAIDLAAAPPRLIATTWFKHEDLLYYLDQLGGGRSFRLLDFKDRRELVREGNRLLPGAALAAPTLDE